MFAKSKKNQVAMQIDYLAFEYTQYKAQMKQQLTGEELDTQLARLEQAYDVQVNRAAAAFALEVGGFLEKHSIQDEQTILQKSFIDIYEQQRTAYLQLIEQTPGYTIENEAQLTDGDFTGSPFRYSFHSQRSKVDIASIASTQGYSVNDLQALKILVKELTRLQCILRHKKEYSEEELGFVLGLAAMKCEFISIHFQLDEPIKNKIDTAFNQFIHKKISSVEKYIEQQQNNPANLVREVYALGYNRQLVLNIIKEVASNAHADNVDAAVKSNLNTYIALYKKKRNTLQKHAQTRFHSYYSLSISQSYANDWNRFIQNLPFNSTKDLQQYLLKPQHSLLDVNV